MIKEEERRQWKIVGDLRWEMTDHYGYPIKLAKIREERINHVLDDSTNESWSDDIRYGLSLGKNDESGWGHYNIDWYDGKLSLYSTADDDGQSYLRIKLNSDSFERSQELVNLLMQSNNLELMPVSKSNFKR